MTLVPEEMDVARVTVRTIGVAYWGTEALERTPNLGTATNSRWAARGPPQARWTTSTRAGMTTALQDEWQNKEKIEEVGWVEAFAEF